MWDVVAVRFEQRYPHLKGSGKAACDFVQHWGGGATPDLLHEVDKYQKTLLVKRTLNFKTLGMLKEVPLSGAPEYIVGVLKTMLSAPDGYHHNGLSTIIQAAEVDQMKKQQV